MINRLFRKKEVQERREEIILEPTPYLHFDSLNFKLAILQILMYELNVLETQFDLYEFVNDYAERPIYLQEEGFDVVPEALEYFKDFRIANDFAQYITEIDMDPMHEIYSHIFPFWDGNDDLFDIHSLSHRECAQFTHLKSAKLMGTAEIDFSSDNLILETI